MPAVSRSKFDLVLSRNPPVRPLHAVGSAGAAIAWLATTPTGLSTRIRGMRVSFSDGGDARRDGILQYLPGRGPVRFRGRGRARADARLSRDARLAPGRQKPEGLLGAERQPRRDASRHGHHGGRLRARTTTRATGP